MIFATVVTHPGLVRSENQDSVLVPGFCSTGLTPEPVTLSSRSIPAVYAVIDGMGGHSGGQEASRSIAFYLAEHVREDLGQLLDGANRMLYARMERDPHLTGMGATIAGVAFAAGTATVFNIGDARVYRYDDGYLMLLTTDDRSSAGSHAVTQSLGGTARLAAISPHTVSLDSLGSRDRLLVCSDGLTEVVAFDEIATAMAEPDAVRTASLLLHKALLGGAPDNVTLMLLEKRG